MILQVFRRTLPAAVLTAALAGVGCDVQLDGHGFSMDVASGKASNEWTKSYTLAPGARFEVDNINGAIDVKPASGREVVVKADRIAKAPSDERAAEYLKRIEIKEEVTADRVRIETVVPRERMRRVNHEVKYWVQVPEGLVLHFETTNGGIRLENVKGRIVAETTNGGVRGRGLSGSLTAETTNGGVNVELVEVTGDVQLETTNGGITVEVPRDIKATLEARCTNGGIQVDGVELQASEQSRRRVIGTLNGGGPKLTAETTNGGIRIRARGTVALD